MVLSHLSLATVNPTESQLGAQAGGEDPRWTTRRALIDQGVPIAVSSANPAKKKRKSRAASAFVFFKNRAVSMLRQHTGRKLTSVEALSHPA